MEDNQWKQATLPVKLGGLGIRDPNPERSAARWAASLDFHVRGERVLDLPTFAATMQTTDLRKSVE